MLNWQNSLELDKAVLAIIANNPGSTISEIVALFCNKHNLGKPTGGVSIAILYSIGRLHVSGQIASETTWHASHDA